MALITSSLKDENYSIGQLRLQERSEISITKGGLIYEKMLSPTFWMGEFRTPELDSTQSFRMIALVDGFKHNHTEFYDPRRVGLISGDVVVNGTMTITSIAVNRLSMRVSGIATGTRIKTGDMLSVQAGAKRALVRVLQDATKQVGDLEITVTPALAALCGRQSHRQRPLGIGVVSAGSALDTGIHRSRYKVDNDSLSGD